MHYQQDLHQCEEYAKRALALMGDHKLAATPQNYALWFTYVVGEVKALTQALDERLAAGTAITQEECDRLYETHLSNRAAEDAMLELGDGVTKELDNVQALLQAASRDTSSYGDTLAGVSGQLAKAGDAALVKVVLDNLVTATRSMASRSKKLEERLNQSKDEVERLKESIETVRAEARTDPLTALSNRKAFDETFQRAIDNAMISGEPLSLLIRDIDSSRPSTTPGATRQATRCASSRTASRKTCAGASLPRAMAARSSPSFSRARRCPWRRTVLSASARASNPSAS
ncbi:MAG: hypothetical protein U1E87_04070 [Alphaproteobacteria bacterium]